jgi:hypothetical protein
MEFYDYPIINAIVLNPWIGRSELCKQHSVENKRSFLQELQRLIDDGHISQEGENYHPRTYSLSVMLSDVCIEEIPLPYISRKELAHFLNFPPNVTGEIDDDFDFHLQIAGVAIVAKDKEVIENLYHLTLEFDKYEYLLSARYVNLQLKENDDHLKWINIVHLDDHSLYAGGFKQGIKDRYFPESNWFHFTHPDQALRFIQDRFEAEETISLIITDMLHLGLNGYEFAKEVRAM